MDCVFCRIVAGELPAELVGASDEAMAFRDVHPQSPTHVLVIPRAHVATMAEVMTRSDGAAILHGVMKLAIGVADELGLAGDGYRMVINTGDQGGQTVHHLHLHILGGRQMTWPPG
jgi:histidine triad (HIT) family protein